MVFSSYSNGDSHSTSSISETGTLYILMICSTISSCQDDIVLSDSDHLYWLNQIVSWK
jgi:hypothetical protein